ncbi:MAG TPA: hypothetical protein VMF51_11095 [Nocardioides sp.]|nr:hypothetical protein [Nocardioides sp.]HTW15668.1 hypothetical protein [Nocardioides sp.]
MARVSRYPLDERRADGLDQPDHGQGDRLDDRQPDGTPHPLTQG